MSRQTVVTENFDCLPVSTSPSPNLHNNQFLSAAGITARQVVVMLGSSPNNGNFSWVVFDNELSLELMLGIYEMPIEMIFDGDECFDLVNDPDFLSIFGEDELASRNNIIRMICSAPRIGKNEIYEKSDAYKNIASLCKKWVDLPVYLD